jgi:hypothetical protein
MRNKFPGTCYRCGEHVPAGDGHFELSRGKFRVQHATCAIQHRGSPDAERAKDKKARVERLARGTGKSAQRARKLLRQKDAERAEREAGRAALAGRQEP